MSGGSSCLGDPKETVWNPLQCQSRDSMSAERLN